MRWRGTGDSVPANEDNQQQGANRSNEAMCPQFAAKSIVGMRQGMEDSYAVVPDVVSVPNIWSAPSAMDCNVGEVQSSGSDAGSGEARPSNSRPVENPTDYSSASGLQALHLFAV